MNRVSNNWPPQVGALLERSSIHDSLLNGQRVAGNIEWGITSCLDGSEVLVFMNERSTYARLNRFLDKHETIVEYTGQGREGNQEWKLGNKSLRDADQKSKPIHLFHRFGDDDPYRYVGLVRLSPERKWRWARDVDDNGDQRDVILFTLEVISPNQPGHKPVTQDIFSEREERNSQGHSFKGSEGGFSEQVEHDLEDEFCEWLNVRGHEVKSVKGFQLERQKPDVLDFSDRLVIEAKGSSERKKVREAIGQVLDYADTLSRFGHQFSPAILLPNRPEEDRVRLVTSLGIALIYRDAKTGFTYVQP